MLLSIGSLTLMHTAYVDYMPITRSKTIVNFWKAISVMDLGHCNLLNYKEKNYLKLHNKWGSLCLPIFPVITLQLSRAGLKKVLISPWLVTLLHICGVIPTPQSPISPETPRRYRRKLRADIAGNSAQSPTSLPQTQTSPHRAQTSPHRAPISSHRMTTVSWCFTMF